MLASPSRPIVLVEAKTGTDLADGIANGLRELGLFLPYSPLHQLLLDAFDGPLVATSGNVSGEPVLTDNNEVERRLGSVADAFLHHDRPIVRPADDPVYRRIAGEMRPLRVGRGCAPVELNLPWPQPDARRRRPHQGYDRTLLGQARRRIAAYRRDGQSQKPRRF